MFTVTRYDIDGAGHATARKPCSFETRAGAEHYRTIVRDAAERWNDAAIVTVQDAEGVILSLDRMRSREEAT